MVVVVVVVVVVWGSALTLALHVLTALFKIDICLDLLRTMRHTPGAAKVEEEISLP